MSRSNPHTGTRNPAKKFIYFKNGELKFYNGETKEKEVIDLPWKFAVLDMLGTMEGYSKRQKGMRANELPYRELGKNGTKEMVIRNNEGDILLQGLYRDIKDAAKGLGLSFYTCIYCLDLDTDELVVLRLKGRALAQWVEFSNKHNVNEVGVELVEAIQDPEDEDNEYPVPRFEVCELTEDQDQLAVEMDQELQQFIAERMGVKEGPAAKERSTNAQQHSIDEDEDDIPF